MNIYPWQGGGGEKGYRTTVCIPNTGPKILRELLYFLNENLILFLFTLLSDLSLPTIERFLHFPRFFRWPVPSLTPMWRSANGAKSAVFSFFFFPFFCYRYALDARVSERGKNWVTTFSRISFFFFFFLSIPLKSTYLKISYEQLTITLSNRSIDRSECQDARLWANWAIFDIYEYFQIILVIKFSFAYVFVVLLIEMKWNESRKEEGKEKRRKNEISNIHLFRESMIIDYLDDFYLTSLSRIFLSRS